MSVYGDWKPTDSIWRNSNERTLEKNIHLYSRLKISELLRIFTALKPLKGDTRGTKGDWTVCALLYLCRVIQTKRNGEQITFIF